MTPENTAMPNKILGETLFPEADKRRYTQPMGKIMVNNTKRLFRKTCF